MKPEAFMLAFGVVMMGLAAFLGIQKSDDATPAQQAPLPGANVRYQPYVFLDASTGCQYLSTHTSGSLTPRIAADGKTHMGCKGATK